ncbi:MAG: hypothetical protein WCJ19_02845 [bacterium]
MSKKQKTNTEEKVDEKETMIDDDDADVEEDLTEDEEQAELAQMLSDPAKAVKMVQEEPEENEEVLYCPNCGVTGLFVDNVCMNCGQKKSKKLVRSVDESEDDDLSAFDDESSISLDEY